VASNLFSSTTIPVLEQVVNFSQARHGVLAGNIANIDTPGYRARDLSPAKFEERLKVAIDQRNQGEAAFSMSNVAGHSSSPVSEVSKSLQDILYHDDSNDSLEGQVAAMTENQTQHNVALAILSSQFRLLQTAISERA
jgi:flagellar basal-body rod protein FlgB